MGNYTLLQLEASIHPDYRARMEKLDDWLHETIIFNPEISPNWSYDKETKLFRLDDGSKVPLPVYPGDAHLFFSNSNIDDLIGLGRSEKWNWTTPKWLYNKETGLLTINAFFRNYYGQLGLFFDWLSPLLETINEGEFDTDNDLEGPRYVKLINGKLTIDRWSYTR